MQAAAVAPVAVRGDAVARSADAGGGSPAAMPRRVAAARNEGQGAPIEGAPGMAQIASALRAVGVASGPAIEATPSDADTRRMPLDCLDPAEQREIRDAMARMTRAAGRGVA